jgi:MFS transporter, DHA2 family, methylenomycin A resistance protein
MAGTVRDDRSTGGRTQGPPVAPRAAWASLAVVSVGLFLAVVSATVVSVALPTIGHQLHASATQLEWVVDAYVVVYASLLLPGGALGDRRGRKGLYLLGIGIFGVGSLATGLAPSVGLLLVGRVIQGLGPALLVPGSLTIIRAVFEDPRQRAAAIGLWSTSSGVALAVGPPLGGVLVAAFGWRAVFVFNVPFALALIAVGARVLPRLPRSQPVNGFDWTATVLSVIGIALLALAVIEGQTRGWMSPWVLAAFGVAAAALVGFGLVERHRREPLIDLGLFARRGFTVANAAAFVIFFAFVGAVVYFSAYFQQVRGYSAITTGLDVAAIGVAYAIAATLSGRLVGKIGERGPVLVGLLVSGAATLALLRLQPDTGTGFIVGTFAALGAGIGLSGTPISTIAMSAVDSSRAGQASAVVNAARQIGQVFGVAVLGALVYAQLPGGSGTGQQLTPAQEAAFLTGLHHALWVAGIALLAAAALSLLLFTRALPRTRLAPPR